MVGNTCKAKYGKSEKIEKKNQGDDWGSGDKNGNQTDKNSVDIGGGEKNEINKRVTDGVKDEGDEDKVDEHEETMMGSGLKLSQIPDHENNNQTDGEQAPIETENLLKDVGDDKKNGLKNELESEGDTGFVIEVKHEKCSLD